MEQKFNLISDLLGSPTMCEKCENFAYGQALYAALCNTDWIKLETMNVLKGEYWCTSWRRAAGTVALMRENGDYMDFYCSGSAEGVLSVPEGVVLPEIAIDLKELGWIEYRHPPVTLIV